MRLLIACSACKRRYDATDRSPGSRFRCHCGEVVVVQRVDGHEAAVVRCGNCAAPRTPGAVNCGHCGAEFAATEIGRNTICSQCMTRCADAAKFCHSCGTGLGSEGMRGEATDLPCPVCGDGSKLEHHQLGDGPPVLECPGCAGLWLEHSKVEALAKSAREREVPAAAGARSKPAQGRVQVQQGPLYRPCPQCGSFMNRRNYARRSGVIIDVCADHGTWFDADELGQILAWIEGGGLRKAEAMDSEEAHRERLREKDRARQRAAGQAAAMMNLDEDRRGRHGGGYGGSGSRGDVLGDGIDAVISLIGALFHR